MDYQQILSDLKAKNYKPVYFLTGEEPFFIDQVSDYVEDHVLDESSRGFDQTVVYGADSDISEILATAKRYPMMGELNVVVVKEAQKLKGLDALSSYLDQPQDKTLLLFAYKKKLDGRLSVSKKIKKQTVFLETKQLYADKIPAFVQSTAKQFGLNIGAKPAHLIHEFIGADLSRIYKELEKLKVAMDGAIEVTEDAVEEHIGISKEFNNFELQAALARKDSKKVFRIINHLGENTGRGEAITTIATLYGYFTKVWKFHVAPDKSPSGLAKFAGIPPFFIKDYQAAANNYSQRALFNIVRHLKEADLQSKGIKPAVEQTKLLEELAVKILHSS